MRYLSPGKTRKTCHRCASTSADSRAEQLSAMWGVNRKANTLWKQVVISGIEPGIVIDWHKGRRLGFACQGGAVCIIPTPQDVKMPSTKVTYRLAVVSALLLVCSILSTAAMAQTLRTPQINRITLGLVAEANQKEVEKHFQEFVGYVARKLSSDGKTEGRVVAVSTQSLLANLLNEKRADFYMESPHPTYMINSVYGAGKLLLRRWKGGMSEYRALIFTRKNSATKRLEDLQGKMIVFEDAESTSGYFLPRLFLGKRGFKLVRLDRIESNVLAANSVTFLRQRRINSWTGCSTDERPQARSATMTIQCFRTLKKLRSRYSQRRPVCRVILSRFEEI